MSLFEVPWLMGVHSVAFGVCFEAGAIAFCLYCLYEAIGNVVLAHPSRLWCWLGICARESLDLPFFVGCLVADLLTVSSLASFVFPPLFVQSVKVNTCSL